MPNEEHVRILRQGVDVWNQWRMQNPSIRPDLCNADFQGAYLAFANLYDTDLSRAYLGRADLSGAYLRVAKLQQADLGAYLIGANLGGSDLSGTSLRHAFLIGTNLTDVQLTNTDFTGAILEGTILTQVNLGLAKGLETIQHRGPSVVDLSTIRYSGNAVPVQFWKDVGVPDSLIVYANSLVTQPFEFYSCFIGYSSKNEDFARRLHAGLQQGGVRCWFAPEDMKIGDRIRARIDESIRLHDKLLLVLSEHSVASAWVEHEVEAALARERKHGKTVLFPIRLDDAIMDIDAGWPALIRNTRHIGDFTRWKEHDAYQVAFERLLRNLKAE